MLSLDRVCLGKWSRVTAIEPDGAFSGRLRDFGMVPGTQVCPRYCSPGGDVTAVELRGSMLALRTRDLKHIRVEEA